ncbi:MAG: DNA repair protein RadA, partial [Nitrospirae bacterium]|nr:DNA repair protein RadA [Nitrospirota bacterium]
MKGKTVFHCQSCGYQSVRWLGRCPDCGEWNSLVEEPERRSGKGQNRSGAVQSSAPSIIPLSSVSGKEEERSSTQIGELDRVLGGGIVPGSVVLIGGDPGIGKSTLLLQMAQHLATQGKGVLYVSGEESPQQVKMRAGRLGSITEGIYILSETRVEAVLGFIDGYIKTRENLPLEVVIVDSIQTLFTEEISSAPGSVSQIRESASLLMGFAKSSQTAVFMAGHVTKDGAIAGPRVLEHIVDTVLYFEGDRGHPFRILRAVKNRFGSTHEIGVFEMEGSGLREVSNPSALFLSERPQQAAGSVVVSTLEGSRPIFTELQALVCPSGLGIPRRTAIGVDYNRVLLLLAILEKRVGLHLHGQDVFINVAGGIEITEPAIDLGVIAAVASSFREIPIDPSTFVQGEVGLAGEIRTVASVEIRLREASKLGFKRCVLPERS